MECDQELTEGDFACLDVVIRTYNCDLSRHASLVRDLRIAIVLNSTQIIAPAAGGSLNGQDFGLDSGASTPPSDPTGAAPLFSGSFSGSGGDGLILVPDLIGLPFANASSLITSIGFVVGNVTEKSSSSASLFQGLIISTAHAQSGSSGTVVDQNPPAGARVAAGTPINLIVQINNGVTTQVPEPSSSSIFILGLLFFTGIYWYLRRRSHQRITQA